jgi:hypothetical protein
MRYGTFTTVADRIFTIRKEFTDDMAANGLAAVMMCCLSATFVVGVQTRADLMMKLRKPWKCSCDGEK